MKKLLLSLLALLMLVGCSSKGTEANTSNTDSANTDTQTVTEVQEIDVEALSAGEIYQAIIDNAEGLFVNCKMYDYDKNQEYNHGEDKFVPLSKVNSRLALSEYLAYINENFFEEFYAEGGEDLNENLAKDLTTIMVIKPKLDKINEVEDFFEFVCNDVQERIQNDIENFEFLGLADKPEFEVYKQELEYSAIVKKDNVFIACSGPNCYDVLSKSFNNVEYMFGER